MNRAALVFLAVTAGVVLGISSSRIWKSKDRALESQTTQVKAAQQIDRAQSNSDRPDVSLANVDSLSRLERAGLLNRIVSKSDIEDFLHNVGRVPLSDKKAAFILEVLEKLPVPSHSKMRELLFRLPSSIREEALSNWTLRLLKRDHTVDTLKELYHSIDAIHLFSSEKKKSLAIILEATVRLDPEAAYTWLTKSARSPDELIDLLDLDAVSNAPDDQRRAFVELCLRDLESAARERFIGDYLTSLAKSGDAEAMGSVLESIKDDEGLLDQCIFRLGFEIESVPNELVKHLESASAFTLNEFFANLVRNSNATPENAKGTELLRTVAMDGSPSVQYLATNALGQRLEFLPAEGIAKHLGELSDNPWMQVGLIDGLLRDREVNAEEVVAALEANGQTRVANLLNHKLKIITH